LPSSSRSNWATLSSELIPNISLHTIHDEQSLIEKNTIPTREPRDPPDLNKPRFTIPGSELFDGDSDTRKRQRTFGLSPNGLSGES